MVRSLWISIISVLYVSVELLSRLSYCSISIFRSQIHNYVFQKDFFRDIDRKLPWQTATLADSKASTS